MQPAMTGARFVAAAPALSMALPVTAAPVELQPFRERSGCGWAGKLKTHLLVDGQWVEVVATVKIQCVASNKWPA